MKRVGSLNAKLFKPKAGSHEATSDAGEQHAVKQRSVSVPERPMSILGNSPAAPNGLGKLEAAGLFKPKGLSNLFHKASNGTLGRNKKVYLISIFSIFFHVI